MHIKWLWLYELWMNITAIKMIKREESQPVTRFFIFMFSDKIKFLIFFNYILTMSEHFSSSKVTDVL